MIGKIGSLKKIITKDKPGSLQNINFDEINKKFKINFKPNKIFILNNLNSEFSRGNHANTNASEIIFCANGKFEIELFDGKNKEKYILNANNYIYIPKNIWLKFYNFNNTVLFVFVDVDIERKESIYDINEFKKYTKCIN